MCGIAGVVSPRNQPPPMEALLRRMCDTIVHRGPDDEGISISGRVGLGMRRLAIIDIAEGQQPLWNEDQTISVVFNGEIYNFRTLRRDLAARGHVFNSQTDGEVIAHLWEEYGTSFPQYLNGMFAIALHDQRQNRLLLVRDRLGIKPMYYAHLDGGLVFGSEIKAILASQLVNRKLNLDGLGQFLAWEYIPGEQTLFADVRKLPPGSLLEFSLDDDRPSQQVWWDIPMPAGNGAAGSKSAEEWEEAVEEKLAQCVSRRLVSDVPLGAFLSGGVDSSLIVSAMGNARTFSIGFDDPTYNELPWAQAVAEHLNVKHRDEVINPAIADLFDGLMNFMDDPIGDFSIFPTYLVSQLARQEVTVALSGDGGDELFGGYETYLADEKARSWSRIPIAFRRRLIEPVINRWTPSSKKKGLVNKAKRFVEGLEHDPRLSHARWRLFVGCSLRQKLFTPEARAMMGSSTGEHILRLQADASDRDALDRSLYVDVKSYLVDNILVKVDRMSMACSLETRVPFLDHEMVELAFQMPSHLKVSSGRTKVLLKKIAARHVPYECVYRGKEGFSIPMKHWLNSAFRPHLEELLSHERLNSEGIFHAPTVERLKREHQKGVANHSHILWPMLVFQDWRGRWGA